jgi:cysteine desulfurase/selenocysteine lyase
LANIAEWENSLLLYATEMLKSIKGLNIYGESGKKSGVISFNIKEIHPYDLGMLLDKSGIALRSGHHCADPLMKYYNIPGTVRVSFGLYNTREEIDRLMAALARAVEMLK